MLEVRLRGTNLNENSSDLGTSGLLFQDVESTVVKIPLHYWTNWAHGIVWLAVRLKLMF